MNILNSFFIKTGLIVSSILLAFNCFAQINTYESPVLFNKTFDADKAFS